MAAKTLATYIGELSAGTSLGAGDKIPTLENSTMVYFDGAAVGGGITALTGDVTASGTGSVAATIAAGAVTNAKVASGIDAVKIADGTVTNAEFQYLGGVTSDIQTQLNAKQASDADLTTIAGLTPSNDDFLQRKAGAWANRTLAQVRTDLGVLQEVETTGTITGTSAILVSCFPIPDTNAYVTSGSVIMKCTDPGAGTVGVGDVLVRFLYHIVVSNGEILYTDLNSANTAPGMDNAGVSVDGVASGQLRLEITPPLDTAAVDSEFSYKIRISGYSL